MIYDVQQLKNIEPKRLLSIFAGSDDWDAELTVLWGDFQVRLISVLACDLQASLFELINARQGVRVCGSVVDLISPPNSV